MRAESITALAARAPAWVVVPSFLECSGAQVRLDLGARKVALLLHPC